MRTYSLAFALAFVGVASTAHAQTARGPETPARSATIARDIGGFELGMRIADVRRVVAVEALGNDNYQATRDGITYDFGVTPLGRVYRMASSQNLGRFEVDRTFLERITGQLTAKYGPTSDGSAGTWGWELIEPVTRAGGQTLPFKTMWASAFLSTGSDGVSLEMKLLDFRILWADEAKLNRGPRDRAADAVKL